MISQPNRKEREEIEALKSQVLKLTEEMKAKDTRNRLNNERLKKQLDEQISKNAELEKELKFMEEQRIKYMSGKQTNNTNSKVNQLETQKSKFI